MWLNRLRFLRAVVQLAGSIAVCLPCLNPDVPLVSNIGLCILAVRGFVCIQLGCVLL